MKQSNKRGFTQIIKVILNLIQDLQRLVLPLRNDMRGRFHIKYTMTTLFNKGFTLIELLVVVLIIGILAAVALPQYQKAVEKARIVQELTVLDAYRKGIDLWILQNGWPASYIDFTGDESCDGSPVESLDIGLFSPEKANCDDVIGNLSVQSYIGSSSAIIRAENSDKAGCYSIFKRRSTANEWGLSNMRYITGVDKSSNGTVATAEQCKDYQRIMCNYWATEGTGIGENQAITQCANFGITLTLPE